MIEGAELERWRTAGRIASEAVYSTGSQYTNCECKEDIFLSLMERENYEHAQERSE